jgi:hypothetical protein
VVGAAGRVSVVVDAKMAWCSESWSKNIEKDSTAEAAHGRVDVRDEAWRVTMLGLSVEALAGALGLGSVVRVSRESAEAVKVSSAVTQAASVELWSTAVFACLSSVGAAEVTIQIFKG